LGHDVPTPYAINGNVSCNISSPPKGIRGLIQAQEIRPMLEEFGITKAIPQSCIDYIIDLISIKNGILEANG
jgi:hypothetical protein